MYCILETKICIPTILGAATYSEDLKGSLNFVNIIMNVLLLNTDVNVSIPTFNHNLKTYLLHNTIELKHPR